LVGRLLVSRLLGQLTDWLVECLISPLLVQLTSCWRFVAPKKLRRSDCNVRIGTNVEEIVMDYFNILLTHWNT